VTQTAGYLKRPCGALPKQAYYNRNCQAGLFFTHHCAEVSKETGLNRWGVIQGTPHHPTAEALEMCLFENAN